MTSMDTIPDPDRRETSGNRASLHQRIMRDIEQRILSAEWIPGDRIPSEQALTEQYGCSRMTVNKALTQLAQSGLILRRRKTGSVVKRQDTRTAILAIYDVADEVKSHGLTYRYTICERLQRHPTMQETTCPGFREKEALLALTVLHLADDEPFCLEERVISLSAAPDAAEESFADLAPGAWLLNHVAWTSGEHRISAESSNARISKLLKVAKGSALLVVQRLTWRQGEPVTRVRLNYPGHQHRLTADFTPIQGLRPNS